LNTRVCSLFFLGEHNPSFTALELSQIFARQTFEKGSFQAFSEGSEVRKQGRDTRHYTKSKPFFLLLKKLRF